jgi:hypothetical protein
MICRPHVEFTIESVSGALLRAGLVRGDTLPLGMSPYTARARSPQDTAEVHLDPARTWRRQVP